MPKLTKRRLADLVPAESNPRRVLDAGFRALVESIRTHGVAGNAPCSLQPVVVNTHADFRNVIVGGQRRWEAAAEEWTDAEGVAHPPFDFIWTVDCLLDSDAMNELNVRLNVPAGEWDWEMLLPFGGARLVSWGFTDLEFPALPPSAELELEGVPSRGVAGAIADAARPPTAAAGASSDRGGEGPPALLPAGAPAAEPMNRQFQAFLMDGDFEELHRLLRFLAGQFQTSTQTGTLMAAVRYAAEGHGYDTGGGEE